ncbi:MAG TPA: transposase [Thiopseudomonas sp.]|nr:transposase [Thiopseudomonas sp.]
MNKGYRYSDEFKQEAVNQVTVHDYAVVDVATHLGTSDKTLYNWIKIFSKPVKKRLEDDDLQTEIVSAIGAFSELERSVTSAIR